MQQVRPPDRYHFIEMLKDHMNDKVYRAEDKHLGREVVIRMFQIAVDERDGASKENISHFEDDIKAVAKLEHPSVLSPTDYDNRTRDGKAQLSLVMPYRQEGSLHQWVQENGTEGRLPPSFVKHFVREAVDALQYIHGQEDIDGRKMAHGNVKPSQFLVHHHRGNPALPDFQLSGLGVAKFRSIFSGSNEPLHETAAYKAPKQENGSASAAPDQYEDQYALAVISYELLTGHLPVEDSEVQPTEQHSHTSTFWLPRFMSRLKGGIKHNFVNTLGKVGKINSSNNQMRVLGSRFKDKHLPEELRPVLQKALDEPTKRYETIADFGNAFCHAGEKKSSPRKQLLRSWMSGILLYFLITLVLLYIIGSVLNALNKLPVIIIVLASSLGGALTTLWQFGSGIVTGVGVAFFTRLSKDLRKPFIIVTAAILSILTVGLLFFELGTQISVITDPYTHQEIRVYNDHLANNSQDFLWDNRPFKTGSCLFKNGAYDVLQKEGDYLQECVANAGYFNDFIYEIHMKIIKGSCGGIIIREGSYYSNNNLFSNNGYLFRICSSGFYNFLSYVKGNPGQLLTRGNSPFIETGLASSNIIAVVARGSTFSLYANGMMLGDLINDGTYSNGQIGVFAARGSEVIFSNLRLWPI